MATCTCNSIGPVSGSRADPSPLIPELMVLRRRMVRDLERFLRIQLSLPGTLMSRWPWARSATNVGSGLDSE